MSLTVLLLGLFAVSLTTGGVVGSNVAPAPDPASPKRCVGGQLTVVPGSFCRSFEECRGQGEICVKTCDEDQLFHTKTSFPGCEPLWKVRDCDTEDLPACNVEQEVAPYPNTCKIFYRCVQGRRHIEWCPKGLVFDPKKGECAKTGCVEPDCSHW